ncbi:OmpA family protein [Crocinitomicaceae bacterium]|jgi:outer membrane protein OmpA-like peptidoglycan-associated protein|nr:OmpA family protein [Crocinitomicaceae bacterium]MDC1195800.1 OmpA family protein [Crocinitomicaceae bacterium]MDC1385660.1 OmpA family protein [Crocinitomicaceae bacterium]|tara:strand:+ start:392 stop:1066 length:675 start_codon:yes stop_codon:yes gene_type:complete
MKIYTTLILCLLSLILNAQSPDAPVTVSVTDPDGVVIPNDKIVFIGQKTKKKIVGITNANGKFLVQLPVGDTYDIKISAIGDDMDYNSIEIPNIPANAKFQNMVISISYWMGDSFILSNLNFETGKSTIKSGSYSSLNELVDYMNRKKTLKILVAGHTDNIGAADGNLILSKDRALAVKAYLVKKGILAGRVRTEGYGMNQPIADNSTLTGRAENRRTEVQIIE